MGIFSKDWSVSRRSIKKNTPSEELTESIQRRLREGGLILLSAISLFLLLALSTYSSLDPGWSRTGIGSGTANACGHVGAWVSDVLYYLFGYLAFLCPCIVAYSGWLLFQKSPGQTKAAGAYLLITARTVGFVLVMLTGAAMMQLHFGINESMLPLGAGGLFGHLISLTLFMYFNYQGATVLLLGLFLVGVTLATGLSWLRLTDETGKLLVGLAQKGIALAKERREKHGKAKEMLSKPGIVLKESGAARVIPASSLRSKTKEPFSEVIVEPTFANKMANKLKSFKSSAQVGLDINSTAASMTPGAGLKNQKEPNTAKRASKSPLLATVLNPGLPDITLLDLPITTPQSGSTQQHSDEELERLARELEVHLADFGVEAKVVSVLPGPVITRFELDLAPGIKASKISGLAKDIARSLSIVSVRVVEVIPGKPYVGIELPNLHRQVVSLSEVLGSEEYEKSTSPLTLGLGKDIAGEPVVVDLGKMPHLLVAGTTGSGKSVGVNSMLLSLLFKSSPEDVRLIMIDPKMLELSVYEGIPHLLCPVVVDMKEAANALRWCVAEMERRYQLMAALGVRNLVGYNRKVKDAIKDGAPIKDPLYKNTVPDEETPLLDALPYVVVVIDEFADMIMVVGKKVEELIARIAQKARAAGIHLILATQRPSVDVITGLIKANIPTRIAFQVASRIDSRTILDQQGAEQLLGRGDMLYLPAGAGVPVRVHGAFVADAEVHNVVDDWKKRGAPNYDEDILQGRLATDVPALEAMGFGQNDGEGESDPLYDQAVQIVIESRRASISAVQRRLKIGYNRAARLIDEMEMAGIVTPMHHNGTREVLVAAAPPE